MTFLKTALFFLLLTLAAPAAPAAWAQTAAYLPVDQDATNKTKNLYASLQRLQHKAVLFGHQDDLAYGTSWAYEPGRSDVKDVTGAYPAVYGWELGHLELDSARNLDRVPFDKMHAFMRQAYQRGGINTLSWHPDNPVTGRSAWDTTRHSVRQLLPGGPKHAEFLVYLDRVADFIRGSRASLFQRIPVIFRPFHENTGSWFWWGKQQCTPEEYRALFRFTIDYLRDTKNVHNLLVAYSPSSFASEADFLERYPGDDYVDIIGFDTYYAGDGQAYRAELDRQLPILTALAASRHKVAALTETGFDQIPVADWWTKTLLPYLNKYDLAYALVWRSGPTGHYFTPYPGQVSADDFKAFYRSGKMIFQDKLTPLKVYKKP